MSDWNSRLYLLFENERTQPAIDLVNRITADRPDKVLDIGCGPGNSTKVLAQRFPDAYVLGIDSSADMIATAKKDYPNLDFRLCDAGKDLTSLKSDYAVVFSNACIQWIPDHAQLLENMLSLLKPGGILAVQLPMNFNEPIHRIIDEVSTSHKWSAYFNQPRVFYSLTRSEYFDLLPVLSSEFSLWETIYYHKMNSHMDIMEWYRGTGLRPYLNVLSDENQKEFERDIYQRVIEEYPVQKNGQIIFRFPRLFFTATP